MSDRGHHCPFLNRADSRCSDHFSLDQLDHAFDYCFGYYDACASYQQLLAERQARRSSGPGPWAGRIAEYADDEHVEPARGGKSLVQVRVRGR
ncbi:MAG: hypothetical protein ACAI43_14585 [Phycisphaerae bacterium]